MSAQKKTLVIHIGTGKTGTTALQEFFWANRNELARRGIDYPAVGVQSGAHHLLSPHHPPFLTEIGWIFLKPEAWIDDVARSGAPRILLSSELMSSGADEVVEAFLATLSQVFEVQIVMYLRRQDRAIMAAFNQQVKAGVQIRDMQAFLERNLERFDYLKLIQRWSQHGAQVRVRPFDPRQFIGGTLIADFLAGFLEITDLQGFSGVDATENANPRLSSAALEFKLLINNLIPDIKASARFNDALMAFDAANGSAGNEFFGVHDTLDPQQQAEIMARFQDINSIIDKQYLQNHAPYFSVTQDNPPEQAAPLDQTARRRQTNARLAEIAAWLLQNDADAADAAIKVAKAFAGAEAFRIRSASNRIRQAFEQAQARRGTSS